ncbi:GNAT family N-acetyltransferase [Longispora albida]|uniref:GNAT family N-acetyltransferase n=1 Tax=Longispora albida TaxID=203523 RepID=UPI000360EFF1|nr:GNAT family N-acetyltransferase [Longispora albida]
MKISIVQLSVPVMSMLAAGDLAGARESSGLPLTEYFVGERGLRTWRRRAGQVTAEPADGPWVQGAVVTAGGEVVGWSGFHGRPDDEGVVEVAYAVDPDCRRRGYAKAMLRYLLDRAAAEPGVTTVRATISPDNAGSLATLAGTGFEQAGEHIDEEDGLELIFLRPAR